MASKNIHQIGDRPVQKPVTKIDAFHYTWTVIKPFAKFSIKALQVLAQSLIFIVKNIPKTEHSDPPKNGKIIKI